MNDNYMKTILSGVKEWTENLTDDAKDKANNALDKANNALDKALYVVNITSNSDGTYSADKTFEEIVQAYNEGKYNIVANFIGSYIFPLFAIADRGVVFEGIVGRVNTTISIAYNNKIELRTEQFATTTSKLPNPYPLTFTGAVNETYDGSSAKTITIPSGGGASGIYTASYTVEEEVTSYTLNIDTSKYSGYAIFVRNSTGKAPSITINREHKRISFKGYDANVTFFDINMYYSGGVLQGCCRLQKNNNASAAYHSYSDSNNASGTTEENNGIIITAETIGAGSEIFVRCI